MNQDQIRNFSIIAHIDHGKSTLADRLIERCGLTDKVSADQVLDSMELERERGITIKSNTVCLPFRAADGLDYRLHLIDTPGHVDFTYEVSRSLAACEGALLIVDASQGVEAQTVANLYLAMEQELEIVPVINKIDLPSAEVDRVKEEIENDLALLADEAVLTSAKKGIGIDEVLQAIVDHVPPPRGDADAPLRALVFDAVYDPYRGAILVVRIVDGRLEKGHTIRFMAGGAEYEVSEVGELRLARFPRSDGLAAGEVGYVIAGVKTVRDARIGDTLTRVDAPAATRLPGFREVKPVVFSSLYPMSTDEYEELTAALERFHLNDAALVYEKDSSAALGFGYRCGFLGLLHLDVVQERLQREYNLSLVLTVPSVRYHVFLKDGTRIDVDNPSNFPDPSQIERIDEPYIKATILMPERYLGAVMQLTREHRAAETRFSYPSEGRVEYTAEMPLSESIYHFYDKLKSVTQGYGSYDYSMLDYRPGDIVRLDILVNGDPLDALSQLVPREKARDRALHACKRLKEELPRQSFKIAIQGAIGGDIIARQTVNPFRKDVTAKCYGGDVSRKRKLLEKQKKGKARMKMVGNVSVPQSAFVAVLKREKE